MRVLLRPVLVPELGLVIVKPGRESMPVFHNTRVLVEPEPKSMRNLPSGVVPAVRQPLAEDKSLLPFFSDERVIRAAGGAGALSDWLLRHVKSCQWPHGDYHHSETVIHRYGTGAMVLCWHCDNQLRDQTSESLGQLAHQNLSAWMIDVIRHAMNGSQERNYRWLNYPGGRSAIRWRTRYRKRYYVVRWGCVRKKSAQCTVKATSYRESRPPPAY